MAWQHLAINRWRIGVTDHLIGGIKLAIQCRCADCPPILHIDLRDILTQHNSDAGTPQQTVKRGNKLAGAAHRKKHTPTTFKIMDQAVN